MALVGARARSVFEQEWRKPREKRRVARKAEKAFVDVMSDADNHEPSYRRISDVETGGEASAGDEASESSTAFTGFEYIATYKRVSERQFRRTLWWSAIKRARNACVMCLLTMCCVWLSAWLFGAPGPASERFYFERRTTYSSIVFIIGVFSMSVMTVWGELISVRKRNDDARQLIERFADLRKIVLRGHDHARSSITRKQSIQSSIYKRRKWRASLRSQYAPEVVHDQGEQVSFYDSPMSQEDTRVVKRLEGEIRKLDLSLQFQDIYGMSLEDFEQGCQAAVEFEDRMATHITNAMLRAVRAVTVSLAIVIGIPPSAQNILTAIVVIQNINGVFFLLLS